MSPSGKSKGSHGTQSELCSPGTKFINCLLLSVIRNLKHEISNLNKDNLVLKNNVIYLKKHSNLPKSSNVCELLLKANDDASFYTGLDSLKLFQNLYAYVAPFVNHRWKGFKSVSTKVRKFASSPRKLGPQRKLKSMDEFLLTLMRLRLGLLEDLATTSIFLFH